METNAYLAGVVESSRGISNVAISQVMGLLTAAIMKNAEVTVANFTTLLLLKKIS